MLQIDSDDMVTIVLITGIVAVLITIITRF